MASFDFGSISGYRFGYVGQLNAGQTINTTAIDTQGFEGVALVTALGSANTTAANTNISISLLESDDNTNANATAVAANFIVKNEAVDSNVGVWKATFKPNKRYVFGRLSATATNANVSVVGALGFPHNAPVE
jgi:hypothetical protein